MVRSRFYSLAGFVCAALVTLASAIFAPVTALAARVRDYVVEACPAAIREIVGRLSSVLLGTSSDVRLLPSLRSHGGLGLDHQHNLNARAPGLHRLAAC